MEQLSLLMLDEGGAWVAQCLEYDISGQGVSIQDALMDFMHTFVSEIALSHEHGIATLEGISPAPKYYWKLFRDHTVARPLNECIDKHPFEINTSEIPEPFMLPESRLRCVHDHNIQ